jgi:hypothetical protein
MRVGVAADAGIGARFRGGGFGRVQSAIGFQLLAVYCYWNMVEYWFPTATSSASAGRTDLWSSLAAPPSLGDCEVPVTLRFIESGPIIRSPPWRRS